MDSISIETVYVVKTLSLVRRRLEQLSTSDRLLSPEELEPLLALVTWRLEDISGYTNPTNYR